MFVGLIVILCFFRHGKDEDSYVLKFDEIDEKIEELLANWWNSNTFSRWSSSKTKNWLLWRISQSYS